MPGSCGRRKAQPARPPRRRSGLTGQSAIAYTGSTTMYILILLIHIIVCIFLIIVWCCCKAGRRPTWPARLAAWGRRRPFGPRGSATLLSRATTISAGALYDYLAIASILATRSAGLAKAPRFCRARRQAALR